MPSTTSQSALADDGEGLWSGESRDLISAKAFDTTKTRSGRLTANGDQALHAPERPLTGKYASGRWSFAAGGQPEIGAGAGLCIVRFVGMAAKENLPHKG